MQILTGRRFRVEELAFSPDGAKAATGRHAGRVLLWDVDL